MKDHCQATQENLIEVAGDIGRLAEAERGHVGTCGGCAEVAAGERALDGILTSAVPPADTELQGRIINLLPRQLRQRRRFRALLPVAASFALMLLGVYGLGGVPGGSMLASVPAWSAQCWLSLASLLSDSGVAFVAVSRVVATSLPPALRLAAVGLLILGLAGTVAAAARWRKVLAWQHND